MNKKFEESRQKLMDYLEANTTEVGALGAAVESYGEFLSGESGATPLKSLVALLAEMIICYEIGEMDLFAENHINLLNIGKNYFLLEGGMPKTLSPEEQEEVEKIRKILESSDITTQNKAIH